MALRFIDQTNYDGAYSLLKQSRKLIEKAKIKDID